MNPVILNYRKRHKKCLYCQHLRWINALGIPGAGYWECKAKDKMINTDLIDMTEIPRWFCRCYEVEQRY